MRQPIDTHSYPAGNILRAGHSYKFPFTFVVPERLLPQACGHSKNHGHIERAHTLLPPTLGDTINSTSATSKEGGKGKKNKVAREATRKVAQDDMAPDMCRISYCVRATLVEKIKTEGSTRRRRKTLASMFRKVRIIPAIEEEPPLSIPDDDETYDGYYCMRKEKVVRRGWTRSKRGRLVVTAEQPKPIEVHYSTGGTDTSDVVGPVVTLQLRFDPAEDNCNEQPPSLTTVCPKLAAATYFSAHPWADFPAPLRASSWAQLGRGVFMENVPLSAHCAASAPWTKHYHHGFGASTERRDSLHSTSSTESSPRPGSQGKPFYTASVVIPLALPTNKTLVPTFHSCLISRIYCLDLTLSYNTGTTKSFLGPTATLRIPIQVTSPAGERNYKHVESLALPQEALALDQQTGAMAETDAETELDADMETFFTASRRVSRIAQMQMQPPPAYGDYRPRVSNGYCLQTVCA